MTLSDVYAPYAIVADDDALLRMDLADILEDAGFRTYEACNVEDAIRILEARSESVQLLISDVQMPPSDRNGFDLARECAERWPHVGIVVASGQMKPSAGDLPEGASFIGKPISAEVVHQHLRKILPNGKKPELLKKRAS